MELKDSISKIHENLSILDTYVEPVKIPQYYLVLHKLVKSHLYAIYHLRNDILEKRFDDDARAAIAEAVRASVKIKKRVTEIYEANRPFKDDNLWSTSWYYIIDACNQYWIKEKSGVRWQPAIGFDPMMIGGKEVK